jgi:hypothetical protein
MLGREILPGVFGRARLVRLSELILATAGRNLKISGHSKVRWYSF